MTEGRHRFLHARSRVVSCVALIALTTCTARGGVRRTEPRRAVHYALADHLERAEVRHGERLVVDLGTPGGAKYTRGGWRTGFVPGSVDGTSAVTARGGTAALVLPVEFEGPGRVAIRLRVGGGGWVSFWLDGEKIRDAGVPEGQWHTVKVDLPGDLGGRGEHLLSMTYPDRLDVDGFRVGPRDAARPPSGPRKGEAPDPGWDETPPRRIDEGEAAPIVFMAPGWSLGWSFEVPEDGRFLARLRGDGRGWVKVVVEEDGRPATEVTRLLTSRKGRDVDVDLSHLEGRVVRLHLVAGGDAAARVATPRIVARHDAEERSLPPPPRNVLLFLVDTVRADALSPYAPGTRVRTPGLDAFASRSAVFSASHSQANLTKPSVATLLTSMLPWQHRAYVHSAVLSDSVVLLPEHLGPHGFHTGAIVTNGYISDQFGFRQGWDTFSHSTQTGHNRAELVADDVLAWLDERESAFEPFFLYVHTVDPHSPYDPPGDQLRLYDDRPYCGTATFDANPFLLADVREGEVQLGERDVEHLRALYDGEITYHDIHFARIVEGLEARGLARDTLFVFVADHGEEFLDHGSVGHGHTIWEELLHVPIVVHWPGVTDGGMVIDEPVGLVDVAPTIMEVLGLPVPVEMRGASLVPLMLGERPDAPRFVVSAIKDDWRSVVVGRWKLIEHARSQHATDAALYDLARDPGETTDVSADHPIVMRYLSGLLGLYVADVDGRGMLASEPVEHVTDLDPSTEVHLRALGYLAD